MQVIPATQTIDQKLKFKWTMKKQKKTNRVYNAELSGGYAEFWIKIELG